MPFASPHTFRPYCRRSNLQHVDKLTAATADTTAVTPNARSYFLSNQMAQIYKFPAPNPATKTVVAVISFGGGLVGTIATGATINGIPVAGGGVLTGGDAQAFWTALNPSAAQPKVIVVPVDGAVNTPNVNDGGSTIENTIDVETIGANCASANLTILFYLAPNSLAEFPRVLSQAINNTVTVDGVGYKPSIVSISWGAPEVYYTPSDLAAINTLLQTATVNGINVCVATGDNGSSDGVRGTTRAVDFPSSCAYTIACGGTNLVCPTGIYDSQTVETAWSSGGGGISVKFPKPSYQSALSETSGRSTPDIALVADPNTGVEYLIGGQTMIIGGTSIVAPAVAAYLACVTPGYFLNPKLYTFPSTCFHDIARGSNGAYAAAPGYDNCVGFGSFVGDVLAAQIAAAAAPVAVTGVSITPTTLALQPGQVSRVTAFITPPGATNQAVTFTTSNDAVASVAAATGNVTAVAVGTATITATTADGLKTATCVVTVTGPPVAATGVTLLPSALTLTVAQTAQLVATVAPPTTTNKTVVYTSSNQGAVTVSNTGFVTAVAPGSATITVTTNNAKTATTVVSVVTLVTGVTVSPTTVPLNVAQTAQLTPTISPANASNKAVTYASSSNAVATVSNAGLVTAIAGGSATITVSTVDGAKTATAAVTVTAPAIPVTSVTMSPASLSLVPAQTAQLTATVAPTNASNKSVTYASSNTAVATVGGTGLVTGVGAGNATITVTTASGNRTATASVAVTVPVTSVALTPASIALHPRQTSQLTATVSPANATNKAVTYTSTNNAVATVSATGLLTAVAVGQATITATTVNGAKTAQTAVTVTAPAVAVSAVTLNTNVVTLQPGQTAQLQAAVQPPEAENQSVSFVSNNDPVATVDATGLVAAIATGVATVTATTEDGAKTANTTVTVADKNSGSVTGLTLDLRSLHVRTNRLYAVQARVTPSTAVNKQVRWSSNNPTVASVDSRGVIRSIKSGTAVITALTVDGGFTATVVVVVF